MKAKKPNGILAIIGTIELTKGVIYSMQKLIKDSLNETPLPNTQDIFFGHPEYEMGTIHQNKYRFKNQLVAQLLM